MTLDPRNYGALGDGVTDDTVAIRNAMLSAATLGTNEVRLSDNGRYRVCGLQLVSGVTLDLGHATLAKSSGASGIGGSVGSGTHAIEATGRGPLTTTAQPLIADGVRGEAKILVTDGSAFWPGEIVCVSDTTFAYVGADGGHGPNMELNRVMATGPGVVMLANRLLGTYALTAGASIAKADVVSGATIKNGTIDLYTRTDGRVGGGFMGDWCYDVHLERVTVLNPGDDPGIGFRRSAHGSITFCQVHDGQAMQRGGYGYGIQLDESCHHVSVAFNTTENVRENHFTNGTRYSQFVHNTVRSPYTSGFNTHASGNDHIIAEGNMIDGAGLSGMAVSFTSGGGQVARAADGEVLYANNFISHCGSHGISVSGGDATLRAYRVGIVGNHISGWAETHSACAAVFVVNAQHVSVKLNECYGSNPRGTQFGAYIKASERVRLFGNTFADIKSNGILWDSGVVDLTIEHNDISGCAGANLWNVDGLAGTRVVIRDNTLDDAAVALANGEQMS